MILPCFLILLLSSSALTQDCDLCQFVVGEIESYLETGMNVTQIEAAIKGYCPYFGDFEAQVRYFNKYFSYLPSSATKWWINFQK